MRFSGGTVVAVAIASIVCSAEAVADVNLEWRPANQVVSEVGATVDIGLYAVSSDGTEQGMATIEAILVWNPARLELLGLVNNGPYNWFRSSFPDDSGAAFDGLNAPFTGLPDNDGDAWYNAWSSLAGAPAMATADGLLLTTFQFRMLSVETAALELAATFGERTETRVQDADNPGVFITGALGPPATVAFDDMFPDSVPTVTTWGLVTLTLALFCAGSILAQRSRPCRT